MNNQRYKLSLKNLHYDQVGLQAKWSILLVPSYFHAD
jgi:hypothetical protein